MVDFQNIFFRILYVRTVQYNVFRDASFRVFPQKKLNFFSFSVSLLIDPKSNVRFYFSRYPHQADKNQYTALSRPASHSYHSIVEPSQIFSCFSSAESSQYCTLPSWRIYGLVNKEKSCIFNERIS